MLGDIRQRLWDDAWYSHRMQHLLKKIRCDTDGALAECAVERRAAANVVAKSWIACRACV